MSTNEMLVCIEIDDTNCLIHSENTLRLHFGSLDIASIPKQYKWIHIIFAKTEKSKISTSLQGLDFLTSLTSDVKSEFIKIEDFTKDGFLLFGDLSLQSLYLWPLMHNDCYCAFILQSIVNCKFKEPMTNFETLLYYDMIYHRIKSKEYFGDRFKMSSLHFEKVMDETKFRHYSRVWVDNLLEEGWVQYNTMNTCKYALS